MSKKTLALTIAFQLALILTANVIGAQSYQYTHDVPPPGPNQGDSGQPRGDAYPDYSDAGGVELVDGVIPTTWDNGAGWVGFNEFHGSNTGTDTGDPQPAIDFDLGGAVNLTDIDITYLTGGHAAIVGPTSVSIYFSTDGGFSYPAVPDVIYTGFDRSNGTSVYPMNDSVSVSATQVTNVRMEFFNDNSSSATSAWTFLGEIQFQSALQPAIPTLGQLGVILLVLLISLAGVMRITLS